MKQQTEQPVIDDRTLAEVALTRAEHELIVERLGRRPTMVELGMFGALWSEHCGYKNSKPVLKLFPTRGAQVVVPIGEENAGAVDLGDGLAAVFKVESHNHPSAIEPFQGAATGVGGIIRDIFTMGARPVALLNSLRFGPLDQARNRYLFGGVVSGISFYGNCIGIPDVGGEVYFDEAYSGNPLVNAMCVGVIETRDLIRARAAGAGNSLMLVGADTGRDGIHGATFASVELNEASEERRPAVQVGNPFLEKLLMEACLELLGTDHIVGMQDLGAAGITSSAVECAARANSGVEIDVLEVARREAGMTPYEVMLSESQERMLVVVRRGCEAQVRAVFDRWDLHSDVVGQVTDDGLVRIKEGEKVVAEVPAHLLTDPPIYRREAVRPVWLDGVQALDLSRLPDVPPDSAAATLLSLLASPNLACREYIYRQYDHQVGNDTVICPGGDAALLRIKGTPKGLAVTIDGNSRYTYLEPFVGGAIAVAEAARNLVCVGAQPLAVTDCLNFGNPEKPDIYYQLEQSVRGMAAACERLGTPVISGNVSLYNETNGQAILPTPVVGMVGLLDDVGRRCTAGFKQAGDVVVLLGGGRDDAIGSLAGSEYLHHRHGLLAGRPAIDLDFEARVQALCREAIAAGLLQSAHDCAEGGLAVAVAESCFLGGIGFRGREEPGSERLDAWLFGEEQSRILATVPAGNLAALIARAAAAGVPARVLGEVGGDRLQLGPIDCSLAEFEAGWRHGLQEAIEG